MLNRIRLKRENTFKMKIGSIVFLIALAAGGDGRRRRRRADVPMVARRGQIELYMAPRYAGCVLIGVGTGGIRLLRRRAPRHWLQTLGARAEPVQSGLGVVGVLYSVLLGATLSQGMGRQTAHLNAFGAQIAALEMLAEDVAAEVPPGRRLGGARAAALGAISREVDLLEAACFRRPRRNTRSAAAGGDLHPPGYLEWQLAGFRDPLQTVAAALVTANAPATPVGARGAPAALRLARSAAWPAGPLPAGPHRLVPNARELRRRRAVTALHATTGAHHPAAGVLVGMTAGALCRRRRRLGRRRLASGHVHDRHEPAPALARLRPLLASLTAA